MVYPAEWHRNFGAKTEASARAILPPLLRLVDARSLVEVGCGNAHWSKVARDCGVADYVVVDGPWNERSHLLVEADRFVEADLATPLALGRRFDMALCLEVAEHVAEASADTVVKSLCDASDVVVFGAAIPLQGGYGHINEQWPSWWRDRFARHGYRAFDLVRPSCWNDDTVHYWYRQNLFVYVNEAVADLLGKAAAAETAGGGSTALMDSVHPEKFREVATYETISMKPLLRALPAWARRRFGGGGGH